MAFVDLTKQRSNPTNGKDQVVIRKRLSFIDSGRSLDVTGVTEEALYAGHIIVQDSVTKEYKPLKVSGTDFAEPLEGEEIVGVLSSSIYTDTAFASILTAGVVGEGAMPYKLTPAVKTAFKTALPALQLH
ncbi:hypothetical protein OBJ95_05975 [Empedobacter falsenii]|uniref:hypothetical protein n=1 Tax=Empedobacter stercoris TaxID=1628248 RepID=UPI001CE14DA6|nr:hypothetical protein [Empedobacter stercoris]MCA4782342.1 hypothetical protein [Empedobacter stercoris]